MCYLYAVWLYRPDRRVQRFRPGQRAQWAMTGPEGPTSCGTGGSRWDILTGGSGLASSGVFVVCGILGNSLSIYAYSCCVWCLRYQRGPWEGDGLTRTHTPMEFIMCRDLGICFENNIDYGSEIVMWYIMWFWKRKIILKIYGVTSWYQSLGLRDSDAPSGVFELKPRIWEIFK